MKRLLQIEIISVADAERSLHFYRDQLGFLVTNDSLFPDDKGGMQRWLQLAADTSDEFFKNCNQYGRQSAAGSPKASGDWIIG